MAFRALADAVVALHLGFVAFVVLGGFLALRWRHLALVHVPAAVWGVAVELAGWTCPLTPLENWLRGRAGDAGYGGGFVEHYLLSILYPRPFPRGLGVALGAFVLAVNAAAYGLFLARGRRAAARHPPAC
jgi:Protein of Unknown function (DUF2784)